jgi:uncharacterized protein
MKTLFLYLAAALALSSSLSTAKAASFDCMETDRLNAAEQRICSSRWLGNLDERLDSWYRRALVRAKYFDQTSEVRSAQRSWIANRNECGGNFWCLRSHYTRRIEQLKNYVEHV